MIICMPHVQYSAYYKAYVPKEKVWFFVATIRSFDHLLFDRTCDVENSIFELFVAPDRVEEFEALMSWYQKNGYVEWLQAGNASDVQCFDSN